MDLDSKTNWVLQIFVDSIHDPKVGVIFDPKSLIQALADVVGKHLSANVTELDHSNDGQGQELLLWCGYWSLAACRSIVPEVKVTEIQSFFSVHSCIIFYLLPMNVLHFLFLLLIWNYFLITGEYYVTILVAQFDLHFCNFMLITVSETGYTLQANRQML